MSYALILAPAATQEIAEAMRERSALGTAKDFLEEIETVLVKVRDRPRRYPIAYADVHRALTRRFRFAIFFEIVEKRRQVVVLSVLHQRRDPGLWPKR